ncbi:MAG: FecR family protein [Candidatus Rokuibacteriota bacterium]
MSSDQVRCGVVAAVVGALLVLALVDAAQAQPPSGSAELKRVTGRVEILRKGQTQWGPAVVGAKLVEGDDIRSFAGASADLELPDGSTVLLTENSRVLLTKLEFDRQQQTRLVIFHLAVGKIRAVVAQAAIMLVRARQSNFAITTPTAVAAARGTTVWVSFNPALNKTMVGVEPEDRDPQGALLGPPSVQALTAPRSEANAAEISIRSSATK